MFGIENYFSFISAILIFQAIPGPGTLAILNATARDGVRAGMGAVLGTLCGDLLFMAAAVAGLATIMTSHPALFGILQWSGAAYLCWIGVQLLRTRDSGRNPVAAPALPARRYFRQACAVSLTNPKVMLFFVAFFPLFLRPDSPPSSLLLLMVHVTGLSFLYQATLVLIGNALAMRLKALPAAGKIAARGAGLVLIAFGIRLAAGNS